MIRGICELLLHKQQAFSLKVKVEIREGERAANRLVRWEKPTSTCFYEGCTSTHNSNIMQKYKTGCPYTGSSHILQVDERLEDVI